MHLDTHHTEETAGFGKNVVARSPRVPDSTASRPREGSVTEDGHRGAHASVRPPLTCRDHARRPFRSRENRCPATVAPTRSAEHVRANSSAARKPQLQSTAVTWTAY